MREQQQKKELSSRAKVEARSCAEASRGTCCAFLLAGALKALAAASLLALTLSCSSKPDPNTLVMIIESSPTNLDPRIGLDAQSERIDDLIFDDLLTRGNNLDVAPGLAERWDIPDPLTYIFHLHHGVKFHDGRPLTARDVKWTFDSLLQGKVRSAKAAVYRFVDRIDVTDDYTVVFHLKEPFATLAVESVRRRHGHRALRQRRRGRPPAHRLRAFPFRQRGAGQGSCSRPQ